MSKLAILQKLKELRKPAVIGTPDGKPNCNAGAAAPGTPASEKVTEPTAPACAATETETETGPCPECGNDPCTCAGEDLIEKEEPTMADQPNKTPDPKTPAVSVPATMAQLKEHFPGDANMKFREECMEHNRPLLECLTLKNQMSIAAADEAAKAEKARAEKDKALGGAGISRGAPGGAPAEMAHGDRPRTFTRAELIDVSTGRIGAVPGATTYPQAVAAYQSAGMKLHEAQYQAQVHHRDLWLDAREKDGENYMALHGDRERKRAKAMSGR